MNIALTARHKRMITGKVKSGAYGSAAEVIRDGLRLLEEQDERKRRIAWLHQEVENGFSGSVSPWTRKDVDRVKRLVARRAAKK